MADASAVQHYSGLDRHAAMSLALEEGRVLVDRSPNFYRRRTNHVSNRVNVLLDNRDVVAMADLG